MPSKPSVLYQWAVAANYLSGPAVGTPTRVAPTSGAGSQQDQGLVPGAALGAQLLGALFGNIFDWLAYTNGNAIDGSLVIGGAALTFTPFTFTATSGTPGSLTATAHGLQTGDGPVRVSNSGGGLPGGLAAGTDYWVIVVDANTLRLAVDRTNTLRAAPLPVTITSNGTGTQTLSPGTSPTRLGDATVTRALAVNGTAQTGHKLKVGGMALSFPSFAFTASSATDKLTFTDHGLRTGDGPVQVSNSGGALPTGLTAATDYWVITVDTSNIKLATSYLNAVAGVAIDLTSNGSGTNTLAATANTIAPADCEVTGNLTVDGNATVSGVLKHGPIEETIPAQYAQNPGGGATLQFSNGGWNWPNATSQLVYAIKLPVGKRLLSWSLGGFKQSNNTTTIQAQLFDGTGNGVARAVNPVNGVHSNSATNPGSITLADAAANYTFISGHTLVLQVDHTGTGGVGDASNDLVIVYDYP